MNKRSSWFVRAICGGALAFNLSLSGYAVGADHAPPSSMEQQIHMAKSKADHEALAAQYENEAKELQDKAQRHQGIAKAYGESRSSASGRFFLHCNRLKNIYEDAAKENFALAKLHRGLAEKAD